MTDPGLLPALTDVSVPTLLVWGEHDEIVPPAFGRAYADAFRHARFELIPESRPHPNARSAGRRLRHHRRLALRALKRDQRKE